MCSYNRAEGGDRQGAPVDETQRPECEGGERSTYQLQTTVLEKKRH